MYMNDFSARAWHYDNTDFVITLLLQQAKEGGEFEFAPFIRGLGLQNMIQLHLRNIETKEIERGVWPVEAETH
eukprot:Pgem_evm1s2833